ncbi:MAG: DoxX family protein [Verrucomicrobiota bacterium]
MKKSNKIIYWISTGLLSALMLMSASVYIIQHETILEAFTKLGYPSYIIYPLALMKLLGVIAILTRKSPLLKEWAYAGFFFNFLLALSAHINAGDGEYLPASVALILLIVSRIFESKMNT